MITKETWEKIEKILNVNEDGYKGHINITGPASSNGDYCGGPLWTVLLIPYPYHKFNYNDGEYFVYNGSGDTVEDAVKDSINRFEQKSFSTKITMKGGKEISRE